MKFRAHQQNKIWLKALRKPLVALTGLLSFVLLIGFFCGPVYAGFDYSNVAKLPPTIAWGAGINNPSAVILCIHGLGMHKGSYDELGKLMAAKGITVYAIDVRGFGDWHLNGNEQLDFAQTFLDIKKTLEDIRKRYPQSKVFLLGESMGGAIALQAAAKYPQLISGLISSVPSGDRWSGLGEDLKIGFHVLAGGFGGRFNVGTHVVKRATISDEQGHLVNQELRKRWEKDPSGRNEFSPDELMIFQRAMNSNKEAAAQIKEMPVLIIQGANDKLVRPTGSFFVWKHLSTPDATFVISESSEHLIFEYGQFSAKDADFVLSWLKKAIAPLPDQTVSNSGPVLPEKNQLPSQSDVLAGVRNFSDNKTSVVPSHDLATVSSRPGLPGISYWIELMRAGKRYSCNNKTQFHSGDEIRIHVISSVDGYAYILMKRGSTGAHAVLFPDSRTGRNNAVAAEKDFALPSATWLKFDENPGTEKVALIFSRSPLDPDTNKYINSQSVIVTADRSGAKDLCPTRMQIGWDDPNPVIMPASMTDVALVSSSMVKIVSKEEANSLIAIEIALEHQK